MVNEARVEANRNNARTHGLSAPSIHGETTDPRYPARLAECEADYRLTTNEARFALETAVAMTFRIDECLAHHREALAEDRERAEHAWDVDRRAEAESLLRRVARWPESVAARLATTAQGVDAMLGEWARLAEALGAAEGEWTDEQRATACDLLGLAPHLRDGRLPFDPIEAGGDAREARRRCVSSQIERLRALKDGGLADLDRLTRNRAARGGSALHSDRSRLVLRYEREAHRRYEAAMQVVRAEHAANYAATGSFAYDNTYETEAPAGPAATPSRPGDSAAILIALGETGPTPHGGRALRPAPDTIVGEPPRAAHGPVATTATPAPQPNRHRRRAESATARRG